MGGTDLDKETCSYVAFLIRRDGQFKIQSRAGAALRELVPWTPNSAIVKQDGTTGKSVKNILSVEAGASELVLKYRLAPKYRHPAMMNDAARAIRTLRARASEWRIDPNRIGIMGCILRAHTHNSQRFHTIGVALARIVPGWAQ